ncbi:hypothetical protein SO694_00053277 [Aureococcus anophagefferens]|uniref:Uncharacterized protein n=1 Tax=Aureococcus anophagefferens TaxID=44056 RepID=A0ABR1FXX3_AURAN|nr:hypothetical protein JL721_3378 [Aureococcus anophagefferens]|mmetsp:Transcript_32824/g.111447  ORF Transcript_32824/g.111447 Transcript_32824/m.111447 type:complete len:245 (-) Transcript_32824:135-869(-)
MRAALLAAALAFAVAEDAPLECPCGLDKSPWPASPPTTTGELKWLHIPKAGSSFAVTMVQTPAACATVSSAGLAAAMRACDDPTKLKKKDRRVQRACLLEVLRGRSPACADAAAKLFVGHDPLPTRGPSGAYAGIFREPVARLKSLVKHTRAAGYVPGGMKRNNLLDNGTATLAAFAKKPALLGCAARMLNGAHCVSPLPVGDRDVALAEERVRTMRFAGRGRRRPFVVVEAREREKLERRAPS